MTDTRIINMDKTNMDKLKQEQELAKEPANVLHNAALLLDAAYPKSGEPVRIDNTIPQRVVKELRRMAK